MRYILDIEYIGTAYSGWQVQENAHTVQAEVNKALQTLLRAPVETMGAGRTDAGVHALQLPTHFDWPEDLHPRFHSAINALLPPDVAVRRVYRAVAPDFHARFTAISRSYRYQISRTKIPFHVGRANWVKEAFELEPMKRGAAIIPEYDSFESFCKTNANNKTFFCKIMHSYWEEDGDLLIYHVKANRFLRGMVRAIVGTLLMMGRGKLDEDGLRQVIAGKDRRLAGPSVAPDGLFLTEVAYPEGVMEQIF